MNHMKALGSPTVAMNSSHARKAIGPEQQDL